MGDLILKSADLYKAEQLLQQVFGVDYRKRGKELLFTCPSCNHHKKKLSFNIENNVGKCWVCNDHGTITRYLKKFGSPANVREWKEIYKIRSSQATASGEQPITVALPREFISLRNAKKDPYSSVAYNYLAQRGLSDYVIQRYNIGYATEGRYNNRVIFPSYDSEGRVNFFTSRAVYESNGLKYLMPKANRNTLIFNELYLDFNEPIIITEGVFDSLRLENCVPLLGSTLSKHSKLFKKLVEYKPRVYIALDRDAKTKALDILKLLSSWNVESYYVKLEGWDDLAEVPQINIPSLFEECLSGNFEHQITLGLN